jgi:membrane associated rhomboid family serine protease
VNGDGSAPDVYAALVNSTVAFIPARTEKQAMDWSLVLISQGIESVIERNADTARWGLRVGEPDYSRALQTLQQYVAENRRRRWQQQLPLGTGLILDYRCLVWILFLIFLFGLRAIGQGLDEIGMMNNEAVLRGEWWRVFTAITLHGDPVHIALNASVGFLFIGLAMGALGPGIGLLLSYLAGALGNLAGLLFYGGWHHGLGASGMIMGALGLLAAQWFLLLKQGLAPREFAVRGVLSGCLLLVLLGFSPSPNVDYVAHVVGFIAGVALGTALAFAVPDTHRKVRLNRIALSVFLLLVVIPWCAAFRVERL